MVKKVTYHAKMRIKERIDSRTKFSSLRYKVLQNGKDVRDYCGKFRQFLNSKKNSRIRIKIYKDYLYFFTKNSKRVITAYHVPSKYLPLSYYETSDAINNKIKLLNVNDSKYLNIELYDGTTYSGVIDYNSKEQENLTYLILGDGSRIKIFGKDIKRIICDENIIYNDEKVVNK